MEYEIRPLNLGEILDQAAMLLRHHFGVFFLIALALFIPFESVFATLERLAGARRPGLTDADLSSEAQLLIGIHGTLGLLMVYPLTSAAIIRAVAQEYLGHRASPRECLGTAFGLVLPLVWVRILSGFVVFTAALPAVVCVVLSDARPGMRWLTPALLFLPLFALLRLLFANIVVVIEDRRGVAALQRSWDLLRGRGWTAVLILFLLLLVGGLLIAATGLMPFPVVGIVVQAFVTGLLLALVIAVLVVFYYSSRARLEGFDRGALETESDRRRRLAGSQRRLLQ